MSECRSCHQEIDWVVVAKSGKKMPLDPRPVADGNIAYLASHDGESGLPLVEYVKMLAGAPAPEQGARVAIPGIADATVPVGQMARFRSHFSTCPEADQHRRSR